MSDSLPSVTIIIPAKPGLTELKAVSGCRALDYPAERLEIIVARGKQPSAQRNTALRAARGELIYFLDDDSVPAPDNLRRAVPHFSQAEVKMFGGPNLCPPEAPGLEQVFALVLASWLAFGPSRARYTPVGALRASGEKELILCNLMARRDAMLELGGFNEALYPNEENALMDELQKRGGQLIYDPDFIVHRRPRPTLKAFAKMLRTYGRGRAEQFRLNPTLGSAPNFVPPLFCLYLLSLIAVPWVGLWLLVPLGFYALAVMAQAAVLLVTGSKADGVRSATPVHAPLRSAAPPAPTLPRSRAPRSLVRCLAAIPLIVLTHVLYGLGFWRGLFTTLKPPEKRSPVDVVLEPVTR